MVQKAAPVGINQNNGVGGAGKSPLDMTAFRQSLKAVKMGDLTAMFGRLAGNPGSIQTAQADAALKEIGSRGADELAAARNQVAGSTDLSADQKTALLQTIDKALAQLPAAGANKPPGWAGEKTAAGAKTAPTQMTDADRQKIADAAAKKEFPNSPHAQSLVSKSMMKTASPEQLGELAKLRQPNASWDVGVAKNDPASMKALQMALATAGLPSKNNTEALQQLEKFKKSSTPNGVVGNNWAHELNQRLLGATSTGPAMQELRANLKALGYAVTDGDTMDNATLKALQDFQTLHHLKVDGLAGANTRLAMARDLLNPNHPKPPTGSAAPVPKEVRIRPNDSLAKSAAPGDKVSVEVPEALYDSAAFDGLKVTARGADGKTIDLPDPKVDISRGKDGKVIATFTVDKAWQKPQAQDLGISVMESVKDRDHPNGQRKEYGSPKHMSLPATPAPAAPPPPKEVRIHPGDRHANGVAAGDKVTMEVPEALWNSGAFDGLKLTARGADGKTIDLPSPQFERSRDANGKVTVTFTMDKAWQKAQSQDVGISVMESVKDRDHPNGLRKEYGSTEHVSFAGSGG